MQWASTHAQRRLLAEGVLVIRQLPRTSSVFFCAKPIGTSFKNKLGPNNRRTNKCAYAFATWSEYEYFTAQKWNFLCVKLGWGRVTYKATIYTKKCYPKKKHKYKLHLLLHLKNIPTHTFTIINCPPIVSRESNVPFADLFLV